MDGLINVDQEGTKLEANVITYMTQLQNKIETSKSLSTTTCESIANENQSMVWQNTKLKKFEPGDKVIVLVADDAHKLYARWLEQCKVMKE